MAAITNDLSKTLISHLDVAVTKNDLFFKISNEKLRRLKPNLRFKIQAVLLKRYLLGNKNMVPDNLSEDKI